MVQYTWAEDQRFMHRAIALAKAGERGPGLGPIGSVIAHGGMVLSEGCNEAEARHDPTAHAEMVAIRRACAVGRTTALRGATLYTTLQPCGMCSMASIRACIGRIVYGSGRSDAHAMYFEGRHLDTIDFINDAFRDDLTMTCGVLTHECAALYYAPGAHVPESELTNV